MKSKSTSPQPASSRRFNSGPQPGKARLDVLLVERGLAPSRERAQALLLAGQVRVDGQRVDKPGTRSRRRCARRAHRTSRCAMPAAAGLKLEGALEDFGVTRAGQDLPRYRELDRRIHRLPAAARSAQGVCRGCHDRSARLEAAQMTARCHGRAECALSCAPDDIAETATLIVMDVSFISVTKVLPAVAAACCAWRRFSDSDQAAVRAGKTRHRQRRNRPRRGAARKAIERVASGCGSLRT